MAGSAVPERAKRDSETQGRDWSWVEASVWTERRLAALDNGVQGGRWYSLMDKVYRKETLWEAWGRVKSHAGAAGVDGQSVERFAAQAEWYLEELACELKEGTYRPQAEIPKGVAGGARWGSRRSRTGWCRRPSKGSSSPSSSTNSGTTATALFAPSLGLPPFGASLRLFKIASGDFVGRGVGRRMRCGRSTDG